MQPITKFNSNLGTAIGIVGPAGSGKTVLGMRLFPKTYVLVGDLNFESGRRYLERLGKLSNIVGFDTLNIDETGKTIPPFQRYDRFWACLKDAATSSAVDAIFVDGASQVTEIVTAKIVNAQKDTDIIIRGGKDSYGKWGDVGITWRGLITQIRMTGKKFVLAIHEQKNQDEADNIWKHELLIPGQTKDMLPNIMSDVWRTEVRETAEGHEWMVRTLPNVRMEFLKNSYGFPALLKADALVDRIWKASTPPTPSVVT